MNNIKLERSLGDFRFPGWLLKILASLKKDGFTLKNISKNGDFSEYIDYVFKYKRVLVSEKEYVKNHLAKNDSWGDILVIKNKGKIVASFGPNRIEKDEVGKIRARPGYFTVLPKFRKRKLGTILWWNGLWRLKKMGADYISISVEKYNLPALKIYQKSGLNRIEDLVNDFKLRNIAGLSFLVPLHRSPKQLFLLNKTSNFIWTYLEKGKTIDWCADYLSDKYHIDKKIIIFDFDIFLNKLTGESLKDGADLIKLNNKIKKVNLPFQGSIELTGKCNLNCFHCYARGERQRQEINLSKIKKIINQLAENGCLFLQLTGGECLIRNDFQKIYLLIRKAGIIPTISTNATLFNDNLVKFLKQYPPLRIAVSLYGAKSITHDQITGIKGSFKKTLINIQKLRKNGLNVRISAVIFKKNYPEAQKMDMLSQQMKIPISFYSSLIPTLQKDDLHLAYCLNEEECAQIRSLNTSKINYKLDKIKRENNETIFSCNAGLKSFHIDCRGKLYLCKMERSTGFSLTDFSFVKCWQKLKKLRLEKLALPEKCLSCNRKASCSLCPPIIRLYNGNLSCANTVEFN